MPQQANAGGHRLAWFLNWSARKARPKKAMKKKLSYRRNSHCDLPAAGGKQQFDAVPHSGCANGTIFMAPAAYLLLACALYKVRRRVRSVSVEI